MQTIAFDRFLIVRLASIIVALFGASLAYFQTSAFFMAHQSKSWPSATGILSVHTDQYRRNLSYQYSVDGATYYSDRVIFGELGNRARSLEWDTVANLSSGSAVVVYYKPTNPKESTLFTKLLEGSWINFLIGVAFFLMGIATLIFIPHIKQLQNKQMQATDVPRAPDP